MAKIIYKGLADVRVLNAGDVKVDGFEPTTFRRHEPTEVPEAVAEALLSKPRTYGRFIRAREEVSTQAANVEPPKPDSTSQLGVDSAAGETAATSRKKS